MSLYETFSKPNVLHDSDKIGLVNPVSVQPEKFRRTQDIISYLTDLGFDPKDFTTTIDDPIIRADKFNSAIHESFRALLPLTGNKYGRDVIDLIDYSAYSKFRPIYCSFSAASTLLLALHFRAKCVNFYGPHISFLHPKAPFRENIFTLASFWNMLKDKSNSFSQGSEIRKYIYRSNGKDRVLKSPYSQDCKLGKLKYEQIPFIGEKVNQDITSVSGLTLPTFLQSVDEAIDAGVEVNFNNRIVILESNDIAFDQAVNLFNKLVSKTNILDSSAILFGSMVSRPDRINATLMNELYDSQKTKVFVNEIRTLVRSNIPVLYGFPIGHSRLKLTVPLGIQSSLNIENGELHLNESPFTE